MSKKKSVQVYEGNGVKFVKPPEISAWSIRVPMEVSWKSGIRFPGLDQWLFVLPCGMFNLTSERSQRTIFQDKEELSLWQYEMTAMGGQDIITDEEPTS